MDAGAVIERALRYLAVPAVVGFEDPFLATLAADAAELGRPVERHASLLALPGNGPLVVSAHIDRHGLITRADGLLGYAAHEAAGAHRPLTPRLAAAVCARFDDERVVAYDAATGAVLAEGTVVHAEHCSIGPVLDLAGRGLETVPPGTPVAFAEPGHRDGQWLRGQLDNALSAALAMHVAAGFDGTILFTCGEEAGRSWEALRDWFPGPCRDLVVLDTSPFDAPDTAECGAVVLRRSDAGAAFDAGLVGRLEATADQAGVPVVWKDAVLAAEGRPLGRTELGRLVAGTDGRVTGATLQVPTTDYHSNHEATTRTAIEAARTVLAELASDSVRRRR